MSENKAENQKTPVIYEPVFEDGENVFTVKERFKLSDAFIDQYRDKQPNWGDLGYVVFKRTYARSVPGENRTEEYWETIKRIVEGTYTIQLNHCKNLKLYWNAHKAQKSAQEMFRLMWDFKFLPAGRGLWVMGTDLVYKKGNAALLSCGFHTTENISYNFSEPFCWTMEFSLMGVGCGFDTKGSGSLKIQQPKISDTEYFVHDSKEGWVDIVRVVLESYAGKEKLPAKINYSKIRPKGSPIKTFGGVAPGPDPLVECVESMRKILDNRIGETITSADIVDLMNIAGRCVVSGGVRRCLPGGTMIHTIRGLVDIKDIKVGDLVKTSKGWKKVVNYFKNGRQQVVKVKTQIGDFECTPNHKMKVFESPLTFKFKEVKDLKEHDRLVFLNKDLENGYDLGEFLTESQKNKTVKSINSMQTAVKYEIPENMNKNLAWLVGLIHGDGYVSRNNIEISANKNEVDVLHRAQKVIHENFGIESKIYEAYGNAVRIRMFSKCMARIFTNFKTPKTEIDVPETVLKSNHFVMGAYIAGLFDADGYISGKNQVTVAGSIYENHLKQVQMLLAVLGIPSKVYKEYDAYIDEKNVTRKSFYALRVCGVKHKIKFMRIVLEPYSVKYNKIKQYKHDIYKSCFLTEKLRDYYKFSKEILGTLKSHGLLKIFNIRNNQNVTETTFNRKTSLDSECTPIEFLGLEKTGRRVMTYDFEVEGVHEFVINQGLVSSNSAEIALGSADDEEYLDLKNPEKNAELLKEWRWCSNNSVLVEVGDDYTRTAEQAAVNGEPGFVYLDNMRKYGRIKDGVTWADEQTLGCNPCVVGETLVATADGTGQCRIDKIKDGTPVYCIDNDGNLAVRKMMNPRITGYNVPVFNVLFDDGMEIKCTDNHKFRMKDGSYKEVKSLTPGDSVDVVTKYIPDGRSESYGDQYISLSHSGTTVFEHTLIAEHKYCDKKTQDMHVNHIDGNKTNNTLSNLELKKCTDHLKDHSDGLSNPNSFEDITNDDLLKIGTELCKTLNRRFSTNEWQQYALENSLPSQFSEYRVKHLGNVDEFSRNCANLAGINLPDVCTRTLRVYINLLESGYRVFINESDKKVYVIKNCEVCGKEFTINQRQREQCVCSNSCNNKIRDYSKNNENHLKTVERKKQEVREKQAKVYLDFKFKNSRTPNRKEFEIYCKKNGVSPEICRKSSPFVKFSDLEEFADKFNHRVISVTPCGSADVWNGTVEDFHNFLVGGKKGLTPQNREKICWVINKQCGEQSLENAECCLLVETFPSMHESAKDYMQTLKYAYLYAKTVTLVPSHSEITNQVMLRNRRIGVSMSGIVDAIQKFGRRKFLEEFCDKGYDRLKALDKMYSNWFCIPKSIKISTCKPSGCRPADSLTTTDSGILTLEELMENHPENSEWSDITTGIKSIQDDGVSNLITKSYRNGISSTIEITTTGGYKLRSTPNHKWQVYNLSKSDGCECSWEWIEAKDISKYDIIKMNPGVYQKSTHSKLETVENADLDYPECLDSELCWMLGYMSNYEINLNNFGFSIIGTNSVLMDRIKDIFERKFGVSREINAAKYEVFSGEFSKDVYREYSFKSKTVKNWFDINCLIPQFSKSALVYSTPRKVRESSKNDILAYICGIMEKDSSGKQWSPMTIHPISKKYGEHLHHLMASVGMFADFGCDENGDPVIKFFGEFNDDIEEMEFFKNCMTYTLKSIGKTDSNVIKGFVLETRVECEMETYDVEVENDHWYYCGAFKSHNTVSLLPGVSPGIHYPHSEYYIRRIEIQKNSPIVKYLDACGFPKHQSVYKKESYSYEFPIKTKNFYKSKNDVSIWEQMLLHADIQYYWSDNNVSQTVTFKDSERGFIKNVLEAFEDKIKAVSFLPLSEHGYEQAPYEEITETQYEKLASKINRNVDYKSFSEVVQNEDEIKNEMNDKNKFCDGDSCTII